MTAEAGTNFVVFTTNRSGSEWVMSTLNSFQDVSTQGELFLQKPRIAERKWDSEFAYPRFVESKLRGARPFTTWSYLGSLYALPGKIGFKLMYKQLAFYPEILLYLMRSKVRVVHLVRQNHLDVMLSYAVKAKIGHAHLMVGQQAPDELRVELDTSNLLKKMRWLQTQQDWARALLKVSGLAHMEIAYEELVRDQANFHRIGDFLGINSREQMPQSALTRIRKGRHQDVIGNYEQVRNLLNGSDFAGLLD
jgi:LPS sulfotransferase NodH